MQRLAIPLSIVATDLNGVPVFDSSKMCVSVTLRWSFNRHIQTFHASPYSN